MASVYSYECVKAAICTTIFNSSVIMRQTCRHAANACVYSNNGFCHAYEDGTTPKIALIVAEHVQPSTYTPPLSSNPPPPAPAPPPHVKLSLTITTRCQTAWYGAVYVKDGDGRFYTVIQWKTALAFHRVFY